MNILNHAIFGLFANGKLIAKGSINMMENEAIRLIQCGDYTRLTISAFNENTEQEIMPLLSVRYVLGEVHVRNLLTEKNLQPTKHRALIDIKDIVDDIMECDSLVDAPDADGSVRCNFGSGVLWLCDLKKLQKHFDIKCIISEGDNIAIMIRNS